MKRLPNATQLEAQQYEEENARRIQEQEQPTALSQGQQLPPSRRLQRSVQQEISFPFQTEN